VTMTADDTLVKLDFGEWGAIEIPPELAMNFIANQKVRDDIRTACTRARKARQGIASPTTLRDDDDD